MQPKANSRVAINGNYAYYVHNIKSIVKLMITYCGNTSKAYFILGIGNSNDRAIFASSSVTSLLPVGSIAKLPCV